MNKDRLYHSDIYLGKDFSDGVRHYKYLKKVKSPSGKWRYIYDESELRNEEKNINKLKQIRTNLSGKNGYFTYVNSKGDTVNKKDNITITALGSGKQSKADKYKENLDSSITKKEKAHARQKLKDVPKRVISRGIGFVNKMLYNAEKKWIK